MGMRECELLASAMGFLLGLCVSRSSDGENRAVDKKDPFCQHRKR
jgi:hypothetical protein